VVSYSVARRRSEIGIRMALGAKRSHLLRLIVAEGMVPVVVGVVSGIATALLVSQAIRGLLFDVDGADPRTIGLVAVLLVIVGAIASFVPARRATGPNTIEALRFE